VIKLEGASWVRHLFQTYVISTIRGPPHESNSIFLFVVNLNYLKGTSQKTIQGWKKGSVRICRFHFIRSIKLVGPGFQHARWQCKILGQRQLEKIEGTICPNINQDKTLSNNLPLPNLIYQLPLHPLILHPKKKLVKESDSWGSRSKILLNQFKKKKKKLLYLNTLFLPKRKNKKGSPGSKTGRFSQDFCCVRVNLQHLTFFLREKEKLWKGSLFSPKEWPPPMHKQIQGTLFLAKGWNHWT